MARPAGIVMKSRCIDSDDNGSEMLMSLSGRRVRTMVQVAPFIIASRSHVLAVIDMTKAWSVPQVDFCK